MKQIKVLFKFSDRQSIQLSVRILLQSFHKNSQNILVQSLQHPDPLTDHQVIPPEAAACQQTSVTNGELVPTWSKRSKLKNEKLR